MLVIDKRKKIIILITLFTCISSIFIFNKYIPKIFVFNDSFSMPVGLYLIDRDTSYKTGDIVVIKPPKQIEDFMVKRGYLEKGNDLMKKIEGMPGDIYHTEGQLAYINEKFLGSIYKSDSQKRPIPQFLGKHIVPEDYFLAIANNRPNSFDGRYFGFLKISDIKYKVHPLITIK